MKEVDKYVREKTYEWLSSQRLYRISKEIIENKKKEFYREFLEKQNQKYYSTFKPYIIKTN